MQIQDNYFALEFNYQNTKKFEFNVIQFVTLCGEVYYDVKKCFRVIQAIFKLHKTEEDDTALTPKQMTEKIFKALDKNKDGTLSLNEFVNGAKKDPTLITLLSGEQKCMKALAV